jgi:hypothetical protein
VKNQDRKILRRSKPISRGRKVTSQNVGFADSLIAKETIGGLRVALIRINPLQNTFAPLSPERRAR